MNVAFIYSRVIFALFFRVGDDNLVSTPYGGLCIYAMAVYPNVVRTHFLAALHLYFYICFLCSQILAMVDGLMVHQEVETLEAIANAVGIGYEGNNQ